MMWKYRKIYDLLRIRATDGLTWVSFALSALNLCSHVHSSFFFCTLNPKNTKIKVPVWLCHHFYPIRYQLLPEIHLLRQPVNTTTSYHWCHDKEVQSISGMPGCILVLYLKFERAQLVCLLQILLHSRRLHYSRRAPAPSLKRQQRCWFVAHNQNWKICGC